MNKIILLLYFFVVLHLNCGIISRKTDQYSHDFQGGKIPMRSWIVPKYQIFPIVVDVARSSFPRNKIRENFIKKRIHFWYMDSEQGDVLIIMDITGQDSLSTLNLYQPQYGVTQPLFIKDPIPLKHFFENLDKRIQALGITSVTPGTEVK